MSLREREVFFRNKSYEALSNGIKEKATNTFNRIYGSLEPCDYGYLYAFLMAVVCKCAPDSFRTMYEEHDMAEVLSEVRYALRNSLERCYRDHNPGPWYRESGYREYCDILDAFIDECYKKQKEFDAILDFSSEESRMKTLTNATNLFLQHCSDEIDSSEFDICYESVLCLAKWVIAGAKRAANDSNNIAEVRYPSNYKSFVEGKSEYITFAQKEEEARQAEERKRIMQEQQEQERIRKSKFVHVKFLILMPLVLALLYLIGIADLDYGYYTFLRIFSLIFLGIFIYAYCMTCDALKVPLLNFPNIAAVIVLILFNPLFPIYMEKETWIVFDIISALAMIAVSIYVFYQYVYKKNN